jgi:hypothetical protein
MRFLILGLAALTLPVAAPAQVHVHGYTTKDGTYVAPHYRSNADGNPYNNWWTKGNVNPYTGDAGTKNPYGSSYGSQGTYSNPYSSTSGQNSNSATTCVVPPC